MSETLTTDVRSVRRPGRAISRSADVHVLVADAEGATRSAREQQLRAAGYRVSLARTAFEALVKATCHLPDIILLDLSLPDIATPDTIRLLNACPVTAHIPVSKLPTGRTVPQRVMGELRRRAHRALLSRSS